MQKLGVRLKERLHRSAFFFGAVLFHLVLALMLIGYVVWQAPPVEKPDGFTTIPPTPAVTPAPPHAPAPVNPSPPGSFASADPIEAINLGGKLAILYTPNDYSDLLTMVLQPGVDENEAQMDGWDHWEPNRPLYTNNYFVWHAASYFRNYDASSAMPAYKLSMNILIHLLHRYDDELLLTP